MRNSEGAAGESDGFIYFNGGARVTIINSLVQDTPQANSVLIGTANASNVQLTSIANQWSPGVETMTSLGFNQWRTGAEASGVSGGVLISCGDYGLADAPGACFQFGEGGAGAVEGNIIVGSGHPNNTSSFFEHAVQPNVQSTGFVNTAGGYKVNFNLFNLSTSMVAAGFDVGWKQAIRGGNSFGYRFTMPTVGSTQMPFARGLWCAAPGATSLILNGTCLYMEDMSGLGITNAYVVNNLGPANILHTAGPIEALKEIRTTTAGNTDLAGQLTVGGGGTIAYTFTQTYTSAPICVVTQTSAPTLAPWAGVTNTVLTVHGDVGGVVNYGCFGRN
jgi:hypothetical protein